MSETKFRLKELREEKGFTTKQVAYILGITERTYKKREEKETLLWLDEAVKLAVLYKVGFDEMIVQK